MPVSDSEIHFYTACRILNWVQVDRPAMANRKGERKKRELVNLLDGVGYAVMPASGNATERNLPQISQPGTVKSFTR